MQRPVAYRVAGDLGTELLSPAVLQQRGMRRGCCKSRRAAKAQSPAPWPSLHALIFLFFFPPESIAVPITAEALRKDPGQLRGCDRTEKVMRRAENSMVCAAPSTSRGCHLSIFYKEICHFRSVFSVPPGQVVVNGYFWNIQYFQRIHKLSILAAEAPLRHCQGRADEVKCSPELLGIHWGQK